MGILQDKLNILGSLSAIKTLQGNNINISKSTSLSSVSNKLNSISFINDILKILIGGNYIKDLISEILITQIPNIDRKIRSSLAGCLISNYNCNTENIIPEYFITNGINIELNKLDFFSSLKVDPNSQLGFIFYDQGDDLNKEIYRAVQDGNSAWKSIFLFEFREVSGPNTNTVSSTFPAIGWSQDTVPKNNILNIKVNPIYSGLSVNKLTYDFVNSYKILTIDSVFVKATDDLFGNLKSSFKFDLKTIQTIAETDARVDKIMNSSDEDETFDDSFYDFDNEEVKNILERTEKMQAGTSKELNDIYPNINKLDNTMIISGVTELRNNINNPELNDIKVTIQKNIDIVTEQGVRDIPRKDGEKIKLNIVGLLFGSIIKSMFKSVLSPKVVLLFAFYDTIFFGNPNYSTPKDFLKKNRLTLNKILKVTIIGGITVFLINYLRIKLREIKEIEIQKQLKERSKLVRDQIISLTPLNLFKL